MSEQTGLSEAALQGQGRLMGALAAKPVQQIPSVGRVVHYVAYGTPGGEFPVGEHRAAIITEVDPVEYGGVGAAMGMVGLCVFNPTGQWFNRHCPYDETGTTGGTWHFPERV